MLLGAVIMVLCDKGLLMIMKPGTCDANRCQKKKKIKFRHISHLQVNLHDGAKKAECWRTGTPAACI